MKFIKNKYYKLLIIINYLRVFGLQSISIYIKLHKKKDKSKLIGINLQKSYGRTVFFRPMTSDIHSFEQVLVNRDYKFHSSFQVKNIVDAGANAGYASVFFFRTYPNARIIALEPEETNCALITLNMKGSANFFLEPYALWGKRAQLGLIDKNSSKWAFRFSDEQKGRKYDAIDMRFLFEKYAFETLDLCKIDIEGSELSVFSAPDADWWLQRTKIIFIELHERLQPGIEKIFFEQMSKNSFTCKISGENILALNIKLLSQ